MTHPGEHWVVFQGQITSGARIESVGKRLERRGQDTLTRTNDHHVTFSFRNGGHIDGFDFTMSCTMSCATGFEFNGTIDGQPLSSESVFIGAGSRHPAGVPFRTARA